MKKVVLILIIILNIYAVNSYAISAKSAVLIDANSGRVLYEHNAYEQLPMASTTKIMTGLLACESGKLDNTVKISPFASGTEGSSLWLKIGEKLTLEELTYGLMLKSGNDAAVAIAEYLGGNIDAFALIMNQRAKEIGANNTSFKNPHGLDEDGHYTTAHDLALIAREAMKNKKFAEIVSTKNYTIPMEGEKWNRALKNHNKLLWRYENCTGIKTGYTSSAKRCLVSSAERSGEELICVTLNASDDWNDHMTLLNHGFDNYDKRTIIRKGEKVADYTDDKSSKQKVDLITSKQFSLMTDSDDIVELEIETDHISIPAKKGTKCGVLNIACNGELIGAVDIVTAENIKKISFLEKIAGRFRQIF